MHCSRLHFHLPADHVSLREDSVSLLHQPAAVSPRCAAEPQSILDRSDSGTRTMGSQQSWCLRFWLYCWLWFWQRYFVVMTDSGLDYIELLQHEVNKNPDVSPLQRPTGFHDPSDWNILKPRFSSVLRNLYPAEQGKDLFQFLSWLI